MDNVENMLQPGDCGTTLGWAEVISMQGRYFPKSIFPSVNFPSVFFHLETYQVCPILFNPQRSASFAILAAALGPTLGNDTFGKLPLGTLSLGKSHLENVFRKIPNTIQRVSINIYEYILSH